LVQVLGDKCRDTSARGCCPMWIFFVLAGVLPLAGSIEVIVAGLGRTGTMSMQQALRILRYKPYHMEAFLTESSHPALWRAYAEGHIRVEELFGNITGAGYNVTMDNPMCDLFAEQMLLFPSAKVVLTEHPKGPAGWAKSFESLLYMVEGQSAQFTLTYPNLFSLLPTFRDINAVRCMMGTMTMDLEPCELMYGVPDKPRTSAWLEAKYAMHNAKVKATVPKERLLVFSVNQGWAPLCAFLGVPIPDLPFPVSNDSAVLRKLGFGIRVVVYAWLPCLVLLAFLLIRRCRGREKKKAT